MERLFSLLGVLFILLIAWIFSESPKNVRWKSVGLTLLIQGALVFGILGTAWLPGGALLEGLFGFFNGFFQVMLEATREGTKFLFGESYVIGESPFSFAFYALPPIIFFSALTSLLYYLGALQGIVRFVAWIMSRTLKTSGAESVVAAANVFVGPVESALFVRPYLGRMTRSETFAIMVTGLGTLASGVMAAYVAMLSPLMPSVAGHLLTSNLVSALGAMMLAKVVMPETEEFETTPGAGFAGSRERPRGFFVSVVNGTGEGIQLAFLVAGMLLVFVAFIHFGDTVLLKLSEGLAALLDRPVNISLTRLFGWIFKPLAWVMGIPWSEATVVGSLLGKKIVLNEFVAYLDLRAAWETLSPRSRLLSIYALGSFSNFTSLAMMVAGLGNLAPSKRYEVSRLGIKALFVSVLVGLLTTSLVGILVA